MSNEYDLLPCPWCKEIPNMYPLCPKTEKANWVTIKCMNHNCHTNPKITHYNIDDSWQDSIKLRHQAANKWNSYL